MLNVCTILLTRSDFDFQPFNNALTQTRPDRSTETPNNRKPIQGSNSEYINFTCQPGCLDLDLEFDIRDNSKISTEGNNPMSLNGKPKQTPGGGGGGPGGGIGGQR